MDIATLRITATSDADKARADLNALAVSADKAEAATEGLAATAGKTSKSLDTVAGAAAKAAKSQDGVAGSAARAAQGVGQIGRDYADAAAKATIAAAANEEVAGSASRAAVNLKVVGGTAVAASQQMGVAAGHSANLVSQFNDIGVMLAAGQNPLQLALQQGTQISQVLSQIGGGTGALRALGGAFVGMLNPISLATIGVIGFGAAAVQWLTGADTAVLSFDDSLDGLKESTETLRASTAALAGSDLEALRAKYGDLTENVWSLVRAQGQLAELQMQKQLADLNTELSKMSEGRWFDFGISEAASGVLRLQTELKISRNDAIALYDRLNSIKDAKGPAETADKLSVAREYAMGLATANEQAAQAIVPLVSNLIQAEGSARQASAATADWAGNMSSVLSYTNAVARTLASIGQTGIQLAGVRAETEALKQGKSLREAGFIAAKKSLEVEGVLKTQELVKQHGIIGATMATLEIGQKSALIAAQEVLSVEQEAAREREKASRKKPSSDKSGARKAAAELKAAEKGFQTIRELLEKESLFQFAEYEKRQGQLEAALNKKLVSEQEYEKMRGQLRTMYFGADYEVSNLQYQMDLDALNSHFAAKLISEEEYLKKRKELNWGNLLSEENRNEMATDLANTASYFGQLHSLTGSNYDSLLKAQRAFGAASALINAWQAYTEVLKDPSMIGRPWMRVAAAAKVLMAGLGAVNAIKGVSMGGGSGGGGSSGGSGSTGTPEKPEATPDRPQDVTIDMRGKGRFTADEVEDMINQLQKQNKNGVKITVVRE